MATPDEMINAGRDAPFIADALETYGFFAGLEGKTAERDSWLAKAAQQEIFGRDAVDMGKLLKQPPPPAGPSSQQVDSTLRLCVNDGGEWDSQSRLWPGRVQRPNYMRLNYLPQFNAYNEFKAKKNPPDVSWATWISRMRQFALEMRSAGDVQWLIGVPPWPHKAGNWKDAAAGLYKTPWLDFWECWKPLGPAARRHWIRVWEFTQDHYPFSVCKGVPYDGQTGIDPVKVSNMRKAMNLFLGLGGTVLGDNLPRYDHNAAGNVGLPEVQDAVVASAPLHVQSVSMDRYVMAADARDPQRYQKDLSALLHLSLEMGVPPGISEGSFFMDKTQDGRQIGGVDSLGAVECLRAVHGAMRTCIKDGRGWARMMLFNRCPSPEGHMAMLTLGARGTCTHADTPHARPLRSEPVTYKGKTFPTHCPNLVEEMIKLGWLGQ